MQCTGVVTGWNLKLMKPFCGSGSAVIERAEIGGGSELGFFFAGAAAVMKRPQLYCIGQRRPNEERVISARSANEAVCLLRGCGRKRRC